MSKIHNTYRLMKAALEIRKFNSVNSAYHKHADRVIQEFMTRHFDEQHANLPGNLRKKMQWYMAEFLFVCEYFNGMADIKANPIQQRQYLLSGALIAICDALVDELGLNEARLHQLKRPPAEIKPATQVEKLYLYLYKAYLNALEDEVKERSLRYYLQLFEAQIESKKQLSADITQAEADRICKHKCGINILFLRSMVRRDISKAEEEAWYELGGFIQYCNDAQDLHKDTQQNIKTFANSRADLQTIASDIDKQRAKAFALIKKTDYPEAAKDDMLFILHVIYVGILYKLQAFSRLCNYSFDLNEFAAKEPKHVRISMVRLRPLLFVLPKVMAYDYKKDFSKDSQPAIA